MCVCVPLREYEPTHHYFDNISDNGLQRRNARRAAVRSAFCGRDEFVSENLLLGFCSRVVALSVYTEEHVDGRRLLSPRSGVTIMEQYLLQRHKASAAITINASALYFLAL